jgi:hypothetical protein
MEYETTSNLLLLHASQVSHTSINNAVGEAGQLKTCCIVVSALVGKAARIKYLPTRQQHLVHC